MPLGNERRHPKAAPFCIAWVTYVCRLEALEGGAGMATPELLTSACGATAKYIKSYQIIGINFLLLLAREGVEGSILADEMGESPLPPLNQ